MAVLDLFHKQYSDNPRVGFLMGDFSCTQIKYAISKCRFFIGARTHSMIAAYSTGVPALALSYSIKSLGIAKDIFGTYEGYVLLKDDMEKCDCLTETFVNYILNRENEIRERYSSVMTSYKESIFTIAKTIFGDKAKGAK